MGSTEHRRFSGLGQQSRWLALALLALLLACSSQGGVRSGTARPNPPPATGDIAPELAELKRDLGLLAQLDSRNDKRTKHNNRHNDKRSAEREEDEDEDDEDDEAADESADAVSICIRIICLAAQDENERRRRKRRNRRRRRRLSGK